MSKNLVHILISSSLTLVLAATLEIFLVHGQGISAQQRNCQLFPETGRVVCGKFLAFWQQHGGLPIFGYPISNELTEFLEVNGETNQYTVQYFQRAVYEFHPENKPPYDVQLALVGMHKYKAEYPSGNLEGDIPLYPGGTVLSVEPGATLQIRVTTFETNDKPQLIFAFYKDTLLKKGWKAANETASSIGFDYPPSQQPGTGYSIFIETGSGTGGRTRAELYFIERPPR